MIFAMLHLYTNREYTSSKILVRYPLTAYIPIDNIPVVDTEDYWLWNSENFAAWNWRQPELSGNWTDGGEFHHSKGRAFIVSSLPRSSQPASALTTQLAEFVSSTFSPLLSLVAAKIRTVL